MMRNRLVDTLLADYSAGNLSPPMRALVASHLELKPDSRPFVAALTGIGGIFLDDENPVALTGRERRLVNIFGSDELPDTSAARLPEPGALLPPSLRRFLGGDAIIRANRAVSAAMLVTRARADKKSGAAMNDPLRELRGLAWKSVLPGLRQAVVARGDFGEAAFLHTSAGKRMLAHSHDGLEVTLVLKGTLEDHVGECVRGDISVADDSVTHRPKAGGGEDCVCFSVCEGQARLTGPIGRWMQRLFS